MIRNIDQQNIKQTAKHVPDELMARWRQLAKHSDGKCRIGNLGLLKAGKSSLYNALADSLNDSLFPVGINRKTTTVQTHDLGSFVLLDTPGLDFSHNDTQKTLRLLESLDVILFVHSLNVSELDAYAVRFLESQLPTEQKRQDFMRKTFWVLTKKDECSDADLTILRDTIVKQITAVCGQPPAPGQLFCVASNCYKKGKAEGKNRLVEMSQIEPLREALQRVASHRQATLAASRKVRQDELCRDILAALQSERDQKLEDIRQNDQEISRLRESFYKRLESLHHSLQYNLDKIKEN